MAIAPGTWLGPYQIAALLGAGGMGEVYRARDTRLGRDVAIKVLYPAYAADAGRLARFEQEARSLAALSHPNVLAVYDVGSGESAPYVVSELLEGDTLRGALLRGPMAARKALDLGAQVARGLAAAHERGIVHRDLKPENIFVTREGRAKVLDFGLARLVEFEPTDTGVHSADTQGRTNPGVVLGTAGYMAPEQVRGQVAGPRADIFAFGAVLYEMLTGRRAFAGTTAADTMSAILKEDPPELTQVVRGLPPLLDHVVRRCLEKNPDERFQSALDLAFQLEAVSAASGLGHPRVAEAPATVLRPRLRAQALGLLAAAAAALGGYRVGIGERAAPPRFERLTFQRGTVVSARFAGADGAVVYTASWAGGPARMFSARRESPEARALGLEGAELLAVSAEGELAVALQRRYQRGFVHAGMLARVPFGGGAPREVLEDVQGADWSPDGKEFVIVRDVGGRSRIELPAGTVLHETGGYASHARLSPDGSRVAFVDHPLQSDDGGDIAVVSRDGKKTTLSKGWLSAAGVAWSPDGREVWFTGSRVGMTRSLFAVDLAGRERAILVGAGPVTLHDIAKDGRVLLTRDDFRREVVARIAGEAGERNLSWLDWSRLTDLSDDGAFVLFSEQGEGGGLGFGVYLRRTDGAPAVRLGEGISNELSPDGKWALVLAPGRDGKPAQLRLLPTGPGTPRELTQDAINHQWASWFPDGQRVIFSGNAAGAGTRLFVQDLAGGAPRPISPEGVRPLAHHVSPDGTRVAALTIDGKPMIFPVAGGEPQALVGFEAGERPAGWSADGRSLFAARLGELPARVFRIELASGRRTPWRELRPPDPAGVDLITPIVVTPDERSYAYGLRRILGDLYLVHGLS